MIWDMTESELRALNIKKIKGIMQPAHETMEETEDDSERRIKKQAGSSGSTECGTSDDSHTGSE